MKKRTVVCHSANETLDLAKKFAQDLRPGDVLALSGDLGSGKTTFIKGIALGLGMKDKDAITSPTFTLMHVYPTKIPLYHFDLYRLEKPEEIRSIGFEDYVNDESAVSCIEWAERAKNLIPENAKWIDFKVSGKTARRVTFSA